MVTLTFDHTPVLLDEVVSYLVPKAGDRFLDCTLGGAGHSARLLEAVGPTGFLWGIDCDRQAIEAAEGRLKRTHNPFKLIRSNFRDLRAIARSWDIRDVQGILIDLGVSSPQLDQAERGFSFSKEAPLDMRLDPSAPDSKTAADLVNTLTAKELADLIYRYGEERYSRAIARRIVERRVETPITSTTQLAQLIIQAIPPSREPIHPATRTFQALRIAVNDELGSLESVLPIAVDLLAPGGRLAVISFHSLEDRIVKHFMRQAAHGCICPPRQPVCTCGLKPTLSLVTRKPVEASDTEVSVNPRSRSAKLRIAAKVA